MTFSVRRFDGQESRWPTQRRTKSALGARRYRVVWTTTAASASSRGSHSRPDQNLITTTPIRAWNSSALRTGVRRTCSASRPRTLTSLRVPGPSTSVKRDERPPGGRPRTFEGLSLPSISTSCVPGGPFSRTSVYRSPWGGAANPLSGQPGKNAVVFGLQTMLSFSAAVAGVSGAPFTSPLTELRAVTAAEE